MNVVNVQLLNRFIVYGCDAADGNYRVGEEVMVDAEEGPQLGTIISPWPGINPAICPHKQMRKVLRRATDDDRKKSDAKEKRGEEALRICKQKAEQLHLPMKLVDVSFQSGKITFSFIAESRVNFRDLVKQLASEFHTRIEMRQIGARNETKMKGGVGCCGRPICCAAFLHDFEPVTIRMAKDQGLSLDPAKISGLCGRLLCCLAYEAETYSQLNKENPKCGSRINTPYGAGRVLKVNVIARTLLIELEEGRQITIGTDELKSNAV